MAQVSKRRLNKEQRAVCQRLTEAYYAQVYAHTLKKYGDKPLAEDLVQEAFGVVLSEAVLADQIEDSQNPKMFSWFLNVVRNLATNWQRQGVNSKAGLIGLSGKHKTVPLDSSNSPELADSVEPEKDLLDKEKSFHGSRILEMMVEDIPNLSYRQSIIANAISRGEDPKRATRHVGMNNSQFWVYHGRLVWRLRDKYFQRYPQFRDLTNLAKCG